MSKYNLPEGNFFSPVDRGLVKESNKQGESKKKYSTRSYQIVYLKMSSCLCCLCPSLIPDWFPLLFCPCLTPGTVHGHHRLWLAIIAFLGVVTFIYRKEQAYIYICRAILIIMKFAKENWTFLLPRWRLLLPLIHCQKVDMTGQICLRL